MKKVSKINAVLIELIIVVLFFAIASIITIQLFAKSYTVTTASSAKTKLTVVVENQMNEYRSGAIGEGSKILYFDSELKECDKTKAYYTEEISAVNDEALPLIKVNVKVSDANGNGVLAFDTAYERQV